ncbi:MAG TPA: hypothetical protein VGL42_13655 [Opitutaceae bacterium]
MTKKRGIVIAASVVCWLIAVVSAFGALLKYSSRPGEARAPDATAPAVIASLQHPGRALLIMVVHPRCPCTTASLDEMGDLLARVPPGCDTVLLRYTAKDWPAGPATAQVGPAVVRVVADLDGAMAARLGAFTSGHCVLVDAKGVIRFYGGLTLSRGHRGRSPAQDTILAILAGHDFPLRSTPVYGCSLTSPCGTTNTL